MLKAIPENLIHITLKDFIIGVKLKLFCDDCGYGYYASYRAFDDSVEINSTDFPFSKASINFSHVVWINIK